MGKVIILTDSTCDLSQEILKKYDIQVVPLYITMGETVYRDGIDITTPKMYEMVETGQGFPKSSAVSPKDFEDFFLPRVKQGYSIIYTGIGAKMSSSYQHALMAVEALPEEYRNQVFVVDSGELSTGIGLLLLKACGWRDQGLSAKSITEKMIELVPHIRAQFCLDTLDYLHKGGRCSSLTQVFGTAFKIKPQIKVIDGSMGVAKKTVGSTSHAIKKMVAEFLELFDDIDHEFVFITHSETPDSVALIRKEIEPVTPQIKNLYETTAGVVVSSHCGPGTIGILYIMK